jgi:hypothetical protein
MTVEPRRYHWSIVLFARNEAARITGALRALETAFRGRDAHLTVLINGSSDATASLAMKHLSAMAMDHAEFSIAHGCKSNAINRFVHHIRPKADFYLFTDATVTIEREVPALFEQGFASDATIEAVSGLPRNGRGARAMRLQAKIAPKLYGQMFAVRGPAIDRLAAMNRRLPVGLYRGDGLLSGFIVHETDGVMHADPAPRILTIPQAGWHIKSLSPFSLEDIQTAFNRRVRQSRGRLENLAWNSIIWSQGFDALPLHADDMILGWLAQNRLPAAGPVERIFRQIALRAAKNSVRPDDASLTPRPLGG